MNLHDELELKKEKFDFIKQASIQIYCARTVQGDYSLRSTDLGKITETACHLANEVFKLRNKT